MQREKAKLAILEAHMDSHAMEAEAPPAVPVVEKLTTTEPIGNNIESFSVYCLLIFIMR